MYWIYKAQLGRSYDALCLFEILMHENVASETRKAITFMEGSKRDIHTHGEKY